MSADYRQSRVAGSQSDWREKVHTLSEALPYLRRYAGTTLVIKYGGHAMGDPALAELFARDVVLLKQVGINPIVVHGGGPQIKRMLERLEIESRFVKGLRVTDAATVEVVEMVLAGTINKQVVQSIADAGGAAVGVSGKDAGLIQARRLTHTHRDSDSNIEEVLDLGFVGAPERIDPHLLKVMASSDLIPVVAPIGTGPDGETLNINADTAAGAIAGALQATRLMMLTDIDGVRDAEGHLLSELTAAEGRRMIEAEVIAGGMIPKVQTCLDALDEGVRGSVVLDGRTPHAVLVEIFTEAGAGTLIGER